MTNNNFIKITFCFVSFLCADNIESQIPDSTENNGCLPDLKFHQVHYEYIKRTSPKSKPGKPVRSRYIGIPRSIRFLITIENIGTADWDNELQILYQFNEPIQTISDTIVFEEFFIPYALKETIEIDIIYPIRKPKSINFYINTTKTDSIDSYKIFDEFYYKNNSIVVKLK